jgi:hypothetical protein
MYKGLNKLFQATVLTLFAVFLMGSSVVIYGPDPGDPPVNTISQENIVSLRTVPGINDDFHVSIDTGTISNATGFILVDLSDTAGFPHTQTGHVILTWEKVSISPSTAFRGSVCIGVLTDSDIVSSDIDLLNNFEFTQAAPNNVNVFHEYNGHHISSKPTRYLVDGLADDQLFTAGGALAKPGPGTAAPAIGDIILRIDRTAGTVDVTYSLGYRTEP